MARAIRRVTPSFSVVGAAAALNAPLNVLEQIGSPHNNVKGKPAAKLTVRLDHERASPSAETGLGHRSSEVSDAAVLVSASLSARISCKVIAMVWPALRSRSSWLDSSMRRLAMPPITSLPSQ